jgi:uncharacterized OsmC-like protein
MRIVLESEDAIRLEPTAGPLTIESPVPSRTYSPFHMLGSALATCTFSVLYSWANAARLPVDNLVIRVEWEFAENPHRVGELRMTYVWPELPKEREAAAQRAAELCAISATLRHGPTISVQRSNG